MVGDPGIEPGVRLREGVTVPCHTLRPVAHFCADPISTEGQITVVSRSVNRKITCLFARETGLTLAMKKPSWIIAKEKARRAENAATLWLFGLHAVRDALMNPNRDKLRLVVTKNAADKLADAISDSRIRPEVQDARKFDVPLDKGSVHQGAALEVKPLNWGGVEQLADIGPKGRVICLDRVTDPHNVGAILRSAEVFGAAAVIAPQRHSAPETGALAKTASGALERQPYLRVPNLGNAMQTLRNMGFTLVGLDGEAQDTIAASLAKSDNPIALVLGAEGPGLRQKTKETCDFLVKIPYGSDFGSLNVSNAAAVSLYATKAAQEGCE